MSSYTTKCPGCRKVFKTLYSLKKHVRERHEDISEDTLKPEFFDLEGAPASLPIPLEDLDQESKQGYRMWLDGIIERMSSTFHPRLPGRWVKIDSHQVPKKYFEYFIGSMKAQVNSVRLVCHKSQPSYQSLTEKISYKLFDVDNFLEALDEGEVSFDQSMLFCGNNRADGGTANAPLSAEEEIARAKKRVNEHGVKRKRPSSKTSLIVGQGKGRATREVELIWWPALYKMSDHGQLVIRLFLEKCEF